MDQDGLFHSCWGENEERGGAFGRTVMSHDAFENQGNQRFRFSVKSKKLDVTSPCDRILTGNLCQRFTPSILPCDTITQLSQQPHRGKKKPQKLQVSKQYVYFETPAVSASFLWTKVWSVAGEQTFVSLFTTQVNWV